MPAAIHAGLPLITPGHAGCGETYPLDIPTSQCNYQFLDVEVKKFFDDAVDCQSSSPVLVPATSPAQLIRRHSNISFDSHWPSNPAPTPLFLEHFPDSESSSHHPPMLNFSTDYNDRDESMLEWRELKWRSILLESGPLPLWRIPWPVFFLDDFDLADDDHTRMNIINFVSILGNTYERRLDALQRELSHWTTQAIAPYALRVIPEERTEVLERAARAHSLLMNILYEKKWHSAFCE